MHLMTFYFLYLFFFFFKPRKKCQNELHIEIYKLTGRTQDHTLLGPDLWMVPGDRRTVGCQQAARANQSQHDCITDDLLITLHEVRMARAATKLLVAIVAHVQRVSPSLLAPKNHSS